MSWSRSFESLDDFAHDRGVPDGRFAPDVSEIKQRIHAMFRQRREVP